MRTGQKGAAMPVKTGMAALLLDVRNAVSCVPSAQMLPRYRNVTIWPRVQESFGPKVVAVMPLVMPFSVAQITASPQKDSGRTSVKAMAPVTAGELA